MIHIRNSEGSVKIQSNSNVSYKCELILTKGKAGQNWINPKFRDVLTLGIAICPSGLPFQATVNPLGKEIIPSKGPAFVIAPMRPAWKA